MCTEEEKGEFLWKYREEKQAADFAKPGVSAIYADQDRERNIQSPAVGSGRFKAKLEDAIDVVVNGDYGANHSALSAQHLQQCAVPGVFVQVLPLREPVTVGLELQVDDNGQKRTFNARSKARVSGDWFRLG